jgi:hypothetical protein
LDANKLGMREIEDLLHTAALTEGLESVAR